MKLKFYRHYLIYKYLLALLNDELVKKRYKNHLIFYF